MLSRPLAIVVNADTGAPLLYEAVQRPATSAPARQKVAFVIQGQDDLVATHAVFGVDLGVDAAKKDLGEGNAIVACEIRLEMN